MKYVALAIVLALATAPAVAGNWKSYGNARYNYWVDVPAGFSAIEESGNGDGGIAQSADGSARLAVWGSYPSEGGFAKDVRWRIDQDEAEGWSVVYQRQKSGWAVWSGSKGNRVYYERAILICKEAVAYFRLEYDQAEAKAFDPIVARLAKSFRSGDC